MSINFLFYAPPVRGIPAESVNGWAEVGGGRRRWALLPEFQVAPALHGSLVSFGVFRLAIGGGGAGFPPPPGNTIPKILRRIKSQLLEFCPLCPQLTLFSPPFFKFLWCRGARPPLSLPPAPLK